MTEPTPHYECQMQADAAPYVLRALDTQEAEAFREHLNSCPVCRREVAQLQPAADMLAAGAPPVAAPDELRSRVMAEVQREAAVLQAAGEAADRPSRTRQPLFGGALRPLAVGLAALAAGILIGALAIGNGSSPRETQAVLSAADGARAVMIMSGSHIHIDVSHMHAPAPGRVYQLWIQRTNGAIAPTDALFTVDRHGDATVSVPGSPHGIRRVMVTEEPSGGSLAPTSAPLITGVMPT